MFLSVVIPAYNEEENIEGAVMDVIKIFPEAEIIVVNDASTDKTLKILERLKETHLISMKILTNKKNMGHGYSVVRGLKEATGDYILYIDADRQIDLISIPIGNDFVSGYRLHRNDKLFRKVISFCLKITNLLRHGYYIKDANCPFKVYRRGAVQELIKELPESYIIPIACLEVLARRYGFKTYTFATPHKPYQGVREGFLQIPNLKVLKFCISAMKEIVKL